MAQFCFYGSLEDRMGVLESILQLGGYQYIAITNYPKPKPRCFDAVNSSLLDSIAVNKGLYIAGSFSKNGIKMDQIKSGKYVGTYTIDAFGGGPLLQMSLPGCKLDEGRYKLTPGYVFLHQYYRDEATGNDTPPSEEIKLAYKQIVRELKKKVVRKNRELGVWIGDDGLTLLRQHKAAILVNGKWIDGASVTEVVPT